MFPIANIIFYINNIGEEGSLDYYNSIKCSFTSNIEDDFSKTVVNEGVRLTYYCPNKDEIGLIIFIKFVGIYQTEINYRFIYEIITKIINSYKNKNIRDVGQKYSSKIAVKYYEIIALKEIISQLEKYYSRILENTKDKNYDIDINIEQIISRIIDNIRQNEYFLKCHRTTKFHDIDIKIWETRQALACNLTLTAIVMLGVTLEECLKTVLKNDYEHQIRKTQTGANLTFLANASLQAEEKFGDLQLYKLIVALHEAKYIDDGEREHLIHIKDYIRNAFIHSDKSKIFDKNRKGRVDGFKLADNQIKHVETQQLSMLEMSFAQGFMQKRLADDNAKIIFYEIEEYIYTISKRFWEKWE
jgi:hypothetical protein